MKSGASKKIASQPIYGPVVDHQLRVVARLEVARLRAWTTGRRSRTVYAYSLEQGKSFPVTDGLSDVSEPRFDASGKYLYFLASTDAGPVKDWFAQSNADMRVDAAASTSPCCRTTCRRRSPRRATRRSRTRRREAREAAEKRRPRNADREADEAAADKPADKPRAAVPHRLRRARVPHPRPADAGRRRCRNLQAGAAGQIYYLRTDATARRSLQPLRPEHAQERDAPARASTDYVVSADAQEAALSQRARTGRSCRRTGAIQPAEGRIASTPSRCASIRSAEWKQIFDEAWRINRDYFYAPNMHGADWAEAEGEVRGVPAARGDARRPEPRHPVDVQRAGGRPPQRRRRRHADRAADRAGRPARRRLRGRQRPLPLQEGLRRPELEPAAARAAHRAGREREGRRVPAGGQRHGPASADRTSTACSRTPPARSSRSRSARTPTAPARAPCRSCRSPTRPPCATATGSRAT